MSSHLDDIAQLLPDYEIGREIGRGEYGIIWSGRHRQLQRDVAIKQLAGLASAEQATRFRREARILAQLDHPHVVSIYDYREDGELRLLILELLTGGTLADRRGAGTSTETAVACALAAASGLHNVHELGILHRDVKPENIMFDRRGALKVTDFGIARDDLVEGTALNLTRAGEFFGTPAYVSPEQAGHALAEGWPPVTAATDQYSLAAVLYELLSGQLTHDPSGGAVALCTRRMNEPARPLRDLAPQVPAAVEEVIMRALARDPAQRFPSTETFGVALAVAARTGLGPRWLDASDVRVRDAGAISAAASGPADPPRPGPSSTGPSAADGGPDRPPGAWRRAALVALVAVTAVAGLVAVVLHRDRSASSSSAASVATTVPRAADTLALAKQWSFTTGGAVVSSPAVTGSSVVVGSDDNAVYALDAESGKQIWRHLTGGPVKSSPTVVDGVVYVGSYDYKLYALRADTGEEVWSSSVPSEVYSSPAVASGLVVVGTDHLRAFDTASGQERWSFDTEAPILSSPLVLDDVVVVGSNDHHVYGVSLADGSRRWAVTTGDKVISSAAARGSVAYIGGSDGVLRAIDAQTGKQRWRTDLRASIRSTPLVSDGDVIVGTLAGRLIAVSADTGEVRWTFTAPDAIASSPSLAGPDLVVVGANDGGLYAVDRRTGKRRGAYRTEGAVGSSPSVTGSVVVVGSSDASVYGITGFAG